MLTQPQVAHYLLHSGLVSPQTVVAGDLAVHNLTSRNNNFKAVSERGPSYLLKQGVGPERQATVAREAAVYSLLGSHVGAGGNTLRRYIPCVSLYNPEESVLVLELFGDAQNMVEYHLRRGRFSTTLAAEVGRALAALHSTSWLDGAEDDEEFDKPPPFALTAHRPLVSYFTEASYANLQVVKITQRFPEFYELLDRLRGEWRAQAFVHNDIRWSNLLVLPVNDERGSKLKIVDWEFAGMGDPCWDVGAMFGEYISFWLNSIPITGEDPPDRFIELARYPLTNMQPAMRRFWQSYVSRRGLDAPAAYEYLMRSVRYGATRLVQSAYEVSHASLQLTGNLVCALQVALNMLQRPQEAAVHLLGIPLWSQEAA